MRVIGDNLDLPKIKNYGYISNLKVKSLLKKTYFTLPSEENIYSIFCFRMYREQCKYFSFKKNFKKIKYFKNSFFSN